MRLELSTRCPFCSSAKEDEDSGGVLCDQRSYKCGTRGVSHMNSWADLYGGLCRQKIYRLQYDQTSQCRTAELKIARSKAKRTKKRK